MKPGYLNIIFFIIIYLITIELVVEYRAKERGFWTYMLGEKAHIQKQRTSGKRSFPYRSPEITIDKPFHSIRIWMASASYAEDTKRKIKELFPNILCTQIEETLKKPCQMINAAKAGYTIHDNIKQLKDDATRWQPDYVLLYSMNLDINDLSNKYLGLKTTQAARNAENDTHRIHTEELNLDEKIEKTLEQMTIYGHLRRYIGGKVLLSTLLHDNIGEKAKKAFKETLLQFIKTSKDIGAKPILVTFSTQYDTNNVYKMTEDEKLSLVRYNEYLSPVGWVTTVKSFNQIIHQTAIENNVPYIDLAKDINGKKTYFTDFIHFTKKGHKITGKLLANGFLNILRISKRGAP